VVECPELAAWFRDFGGWGPTHTAVRAAIDDGLGEAGADPARAARDDHYLPVQPHPRLPFIT
ncbi:hypothetical protein ABZZ80_19975, partial [Streptomyces sp. NPDC006356]